MIMPIFAIIGRPNVGKSTLFNRLTRSRDALVADFPGLTRDRQYGTSIFKDHPFMLVDTGGIEDENTSSQMNQLVNQQIEEAIDQADYILFLIDAQMGITPADELIATKLRPLAAKVLVLANKADNQLLDIHALDAYRLGFEKVYPISARRGKGVENFLSDILPFHDPSDEIIPKNTEEVTSQAIRLAFVGKPNVGKSTLVNKILGENRVIVSNQPGTTRTKIAIPFQHNRQPYLLIDTAGVRPKRRVTDKIEQFSVIQTLQTINVADIVLLILDSTATLTEQDLRLIRYVLNLHKPFILVFNKCDLLDSDSKQAVKAAIERKLNFIQSTPMLFISALCRTRFKELYETVEKLYRKMRKKISTAELNKALQAAVYDHQPPLVRGKLVKLNYAHLGGHQPLTIIIHGTRLKHLPQSYVTYLYRFLQKYLKVESIPIQIKLQEK